MRGIRLGIRRRAAWDRRGAGRPAGETTRPTKSARPPARATAGEGEYTQVFLYRVPKANHAAFAEAEGKLEAIFRRAGILRAGFYVLGEGRIFKGFEDARTTLHAAPGEEVWVEVDEYRDAADSLRVIERIGQDPEALPLFARVLELVTAGVVCVQGNGTRVHPLA